MTGRRTGMRDYDGETAKDGSGWNQPAGSSLQKGCPRLWNKGLQPPRGFPTLVPLWNAHQETRKELSCACRKLNESIDPASLNKFSFWLARELVLVVTGALRQGSLDATCLTPLFYSKMKHIQIGIEQTSLTFNHHLLQFRKWAEEKQWHRGDILFQGLPTAATQH